MVINSLKIKDQRIREIIEEIKPKLNTKDEYRSRELTIKL